MPSRFPIVSPAAVLFLACSLACSSEKAPAAADTTAQSMAVPPATSAAGTPAAPAMAASATTDRDFLRKLADHHKGMIAMAHLTKESSARLGTKPLAVRIDNEQDDEIDKIVTLLERGFKDPYTPTISAADQAMLDDLKTKHGAAYDHAFLEHTVAHCTAALQMIDAYLPTASNADAKALATTIRARLSAEIPEFTAAAAKGR